MNYAIIIANSKSELKSIQKSLQRSKEEWQIIDKVPGISLNLLTSHNKFIMFPSLKELSSSILELKEVENDFFENHNFSLKCDFNSFESLKRQKVEERRNLQEEFEKVKTEKKKNNCTENSATFEISPFDNYELEQRKRENEIEDFQIAREFQSVPLRIEEDYYYKEEDKFQEWRKFGNYDDFYGDEENCQNRTNFENDENWEQFRKRKKSKILTNLEKRVEILSLERDQEKSKVDFLMSKVTEMSEKLDQISKTNQGSKKTPKIRNKILQKNSTKLNTKSRDTSKTGNSTRNSSKYLPKIPFGRGIKRKERLSLKEERNKLKSSKQDKQEKIKNGYHRRTKTQNYGKNELRKYISKEEKRLLNNNESMSIDTKIQKPSLSFERKTRKNEDMKVLIIKEGRYTIGDNEYEVYCYQGELKVRLGMRPVKFFEFRNILGVVEDFKFVAAED